MSEAEQASRSRYWVIFLVSIAGIAILIAIAPSIVDVWLEGRGEEGSGRGTFGDQFGMVGAFFSGCAFAGVVVALLMQSEDLGLQQRELVETRRVLDEQRQQQALQAQVLGKQAFESTFFQMIRLLGEIVEGTKDRRGRGFVLEGREVFERIGKGVRETLRERCQGVVPDDEGGRRAALNDVYLEMYWENYSARLGHYFRSVYVTFKLVDESDVEDKRLYTRIVRAQLSEIELVLLFYNCISDLGCKKFLPLAERYDLFDNLSPSALANPDDTRLVHSSYAMHGGQCPRGQAT